MTCGECSNINHFKYKYCCLHECEEHGFCLGCENLNRNKDLSQCKNKRTKSHENLAL